MIRDDSPNSVLRRKQEKNFITWYKGERERRNTIFQLDMRFGMIDEKTQDVSLELALEDNVKKERGLRSDNRSIEKRLREIEQEVVKLKKEELVLLERLADNLEKLPEKSNGNSKLDELDDLESLVF